MLPSDKSAPPANSIENREPPLATEEPCPPTATCISDSTAGTGTSTGAALVLEPAKQEEVTLEVRDNFN